MTTKELLALVADWRDNAKRWREESKAMTGDYERQRHWATAAEHAGAYADELAPIATALCAEVEASKADAERYRWMVSVMNQRLNPAMSDVLAAFHKNDKAALDAAIDAAKEPK